MILKYPFLLALLIVPIYYYMAYRKNNAQNRGRLTLSSLSSLPPSTSLKVFAIENLHWLRIIALTFFVVALTRPQILDEEQKSNIEGIDIVMALDISNSMYGQDLYPNRLEAAKETANDFILKRKNDRIGLVLFSGESFTICPLTTDHKVLSQLLMDVGGRIMKDGTAIGVGLATSVNRLKESDAASKVIILLTDGANNAGIIDPRTALDLAVSKGIVVYTIGVGRQGRDFDEVVLKEIADKTSGKYFNAANNQDLSACYNAIDRMEKSKIEIENIAKATEWYRPFLKIALCLLLFEFLLRFGWARALS